MAALGNAAYSSTYEALPGSATIITSVPWPSFNLGPAAAPQGEDGSGLPGVQVATIPAQGQMWPRGGSNQTSAGHTIQEEGTALTTRPALNFVGSGVTATDDSANARTLVTIPGSAGGTTILSGTAAPTGATGAVGDFYLDTDDNIMYGPKAGAYGVAQTAWTSPTIADASNITGSMGQDLTFATAGRITALRYWRSATVPGTVTSTTLRVWSSVGVELGQATTSNETVGGAWWTATLSTPVAIGAGQKVRVSWDFPTSRMRASATSPTVPFTNGAISVGNSWYRIGSVGYPTDYNGTAGILADAYFESSVSNPWPIAVKSEISTSRNTATITTASLANNAQETGTVTLAKGYRLLRIETNVAARVRLYSTTAKRDADLARAVGTDPTGDHGVIFDYATTASVLTADLSPVVDGFDGKTTPDGIIPWTITNLSGASSVVTATLTWVSTE